MTLASGDLKRALDRRAGEIAPCGPFCYHHPVLGVVKSFLTWLSRSTITFLFVLAAFLLSELVARGLEVVLDTPPGAMAVPTLFLNLVAVLGALEVRRRVRKRRAR